MATKESMDPIRDAMLVPLPQTVIPTEDLSPSGEPALSLPKGTYFSV